MTLRSTSKLRFSVFGGMAVLMLGGMVAGFWPLISANRQMQAFCAAQSAGTPLAQAQAQAEALGYVLASAASGVALVDDPMGFGRRQCSLALDAQNRVRAP